MSLLEAKMKLFLFKLLSKPSLCRKNLREVLEIIKELIKDCDIQGLPYWIQNISLERLETQAQQDPLFVQPSSGIAGFRDEMIKGEKKSIPNQYHYKSVFDTFRAVVQSDPERRLAALRLDKEKILSESEYIYIKFRFFFFLRV